jgi:hypothetical protein
VLAAVVPSSATVAVAACTRDGEVSGLTVILPPFQGQSAKAGTNPLTHATGLEIQGSISSKGLGIRDLGFWNLGKASTELRFANSPPSVR